MKLTSHDIDVFFLVSNVYSQFIRSKNCLAGRNLASLGDHSRDSSNLSLTSYTTKHGETGNYIYFFPAALSM